VDETRSVPVADLLAERMSYYEQLAGGRRAVWAQVRLAGHGQLHAAMKPGQLVVVGGRPSMGKSAFALNMASHVAYEQGAPVLFVSLEMTKEELTDRLLSAYGRVEGRRISTGEAARADWGRFGRRHERGRVEPQPGDRRHPALTSSQIAGKARRVPFSSPRPGLDRDRLRPSSSEVQRQSRRT